MSGPSDERAIELEARYTHLERTLQELSDVVYRQQRQIDALAAELDRVRQRSGAEPGLVDAGREEKPPHY